MPAVLSKKVLTVVEAARTRWTGWAACLERFVRLEEFICRYWSRQTSSYRTKYKESQLSTEDWSIVHQLEALLHRVKETTVLLEGEAYVTASFAWPIVQSLKIFVEEMLDDEVEDEDDASDDTDNEEDEDDEDDDEEAEDDDDEDAGGLRGIDKVLPHHRKGKRVEIETDQLETEIVNYLERFKKALDERFAEPRNIQVGFLPPLSLSLSLFSHTHSPSLSLSLSLYYLSLSTFSLSLFPYSLSPCFSTHS